MTTLDTTILLAQWIDGSTRSEYLCADLLDRENYTDIEPQAPRGGGDGRKDVLCKKSGKKWLAAAYFPSTSKSFSDVKSKFTHDFEGVARHKAKGFIFFTNQRLTIDERKKLRELAVGVACRIYDVEGLRVLLDGTRGIDLRLKYLGKEMTKEEQLAFFGKVWTDNARSLKRQSKKIDAIYHQTMALGQTLQSPSLLYGRGVDEAAAVRFPTVNLTTEILRWLHRVTLEETDIPPISLGQLRTTDVWVGKTGTPAKQAVFTPVPADQVPERLEALLAAWRVGYAQLRIYDREDVVQELAHFHHTFLQIHPFMDGNGRLARVILCQQVRELLQKEVFGLFTGTDTEAYYKALQSADAGTIEPLAQLIDLSIG